MNDKSMLLEGVRVVEIGDEVGALAGRFLAAAGADVIKIEPPGGAPSRSYAPFIQRDDDDTLESLYWAYYNAGKSSVVVDLDSSSDVEALRALISTADVVIDGAGIGVLDSVGLTYASLADVNERLIYLSITPFGLEGPWAGYKSNNLVSFAMSGLLQDCGYDDHALAPICPDGNQAMNTASGQALSAIWLALFWRESSGVGQFIDLSIHDSCAITVEFSDLYWWHNQAETHRQTCRHAFPAPTEQNLYETADGRYVVGVLILHHQHVWENVRSWLDELGLLLDFADPAYDSPAHRRENQHLIHDRIASLALMLPAADFYHRAQAAGWTVGTLRYPEDLLDDVQLVSRDFWDVVQIGGRPVSFPGAPYNFSSWEFKTSAPPALDDRTADAVNPAS